MPLAALRLRRADSAWRGGGFLLPGRPRKPSREMDSVSKIPPKARAVDKHSFDGKGNPSDVCLVAKEKSRAERDKNPKPAAEPVSQPMNTEKTNGESTPPAITSFSPARRGASSPRK